ncbi:hypothetical protein D9615_007786 [Tricholomella constricta]|uniref:Uncharacterized protein n=1 Tax=Tricholomella constricta TaxID=117010 RepID=A0A8H5H4Q0_9AGAR|nr:hypothetical protein D9615_007786 [Tricholomella constricta]
MFRDYDFSPRVTYRFRSQGPKKMPLEEFNELQVLHLYLSPSFRGPDRSKTRPSEAYCPTCDPKSTSDETSLSSAALKTVHEAQNLQKTMHEDDHRPFPGIKLDVRPPLSSGSLCPWCIRR